MINAQTPEDRDSFFEQYSEEQVRHAFDMVADENGKLPEELAEYQQDYDAMAVDPEAMGRYRDVLQFREALFRATPRVFITRLLLAANLLVFLAMALSGVSITSPTGEQLIAWGANAGWLTLDGHSWRLFTCMFLHIGLMHIAFNMYLLWQAGNLLERLTGNAGFLLLYLGSGLIASLASLYWNQTVLSAGASGAVFGICGGLLAFIWRSPDCDMDIFGSLLSGITKLVLINLALGFGVNLLSNGLQIDMAAHVGGLLSGGLFGLILARPIKTSSKQDLFSRNAQALGLATAVVAAGIYWAPPAPKNPLELAKKAVNQAVQLEKDVHALAEQQLALEIATGTKIGELMEENNNDRQDIPKVLERNRAISAAFADLTKTLQSDFLPTWREYEKEGKTLRATWPVALGTKPLDALLKLISEKRAQTEKRVKQLSETEKRVKQRSAPPAQEANALNHRQGSVPLVCYT